MSNHVTPTASIGFRAKPRLNGSNKRQDHHLARAAIVYVRQSDPHQVQENTESTELQYALVDRAVQLGWSADRVEVIDDDQGHSGTTAEGRLGFQRLLAEVGLNHVGIILGTEMSRIARSNKDWHQLLELCAIFRTLIADQDGLFDPTDYNDRLLLGLRGMMSEAEIQILRGRLHEALLNKARRGDLYMLPPVGYVKLPAGGFAVDPDEQAQSVIRLIFEEFDRWGSMHGVLRYLRANDIKFPIRPHKGPNKGLLEWRRATSGTLHTVLTHPLYAGVYHFGRHQTDPRRKRPGRRGSGRRLVKPEDYYVWIPDHCPAYITRERYERNQKMIQENRIMLPSKGPSRDGEALLGGLLVCARCQLRMQIEYRGKRGESYQYSCCNRRHDPDVPRCQCLSGRVLDELVTEKIMLALRPAALELSLQAADDLKQERQRLHRDWRQRLERCRYEADRAQRQFQVVEPENRLVARELEHQWERGLQQLEALTQDYARFRQTHPITLSDEQRDLIRSLSENLPALWKASTTSGSDRKRVVRLLIERIVVQVHDSSEHVDVALHWSGGFTSQHDLLRPVLGYRQMADYERLADRVEDLRRQALTFQEIAEHLNREGFRPNQRAEKFNGEIVCRIFRKLQKQRPSAREIENQAQLGENEWFISSLAAQLQIEKCILRVWIRRGWVHVARQLPGSNGRKICWADADEINRLTRLRDTPKKWWDLPIPAELTTTKIPSSAETPQRATRRRSY
jgi:DNA invertase Pin-like site-specific DNA recombinase